jgi:hypothetical protein
MNTKKLTLAIVIVTAAASLLIAPSIYDAGFLAKKSCNVGESDNDCNEHNRDTPAANCENPQGKEVNCKGNTD